MRIARKKKRKDDTGTEPFGDSHLDSYISNLNSSGRSLSDSTLSFFESRFGYDFSSVKIHTDETASKAAQSINALAFTVGNNIVFNEGQFSPESDSGKRLLAHELTHVVQQGENISPKIIQRDLAIAPPSQDAAATELTAEAVATAIQFNTTKLDPVKNAALIGQLRDVLGVSPTPQDIDEDFIRAIGRWQAMHNLRQDGMLGPNTAAPLFRELRAEGLTAEATQLTNLVRRCRVASGPTYTPHVVAATVTGGGKSAHFDFAASFQLNHNEGVFCNCCEVRQAISWDPTAAASFAPGIVPHGGFPAAQAANSPIEDREQADKRYGHRTGAFSDLHDTFDQYFNATGVADSLNGCTYAGNDTPGGPSTLAGQYVFTISVVDVCNNEQPVGGTDTVTVNW